MSDTSITLISCDLAENIGFWANYWCEFDKKWGLHDYEDLRNLFLIIGGSLGLVLAYWRTTMSQKQTDTALKQARTSEQGLNIDRYQKGASMLGHEKLSVRQAGIFVLSELAQQNMEEYFDQVQKVLCIFVRDHSGFINDHSGSNKKIKIFSVNDNYSVYQAGISSDCKTAIFELSKLNTLAQENSKFANTSFDLRWCNLQDANLKDLNLSYAKMNQSSFLEASCHGLNFKGADLKNVNFKHLSDKCTWSTAQGLTYTQLSQAKNVDPDFLEQLRLKEDTEQDAVKD